jgi:acylphosphatase
MSYHRAQPQHTKFRFNGDSLLTAEIANGRGFCFELQRRVTLEFAVPSKARTARRWLIRGRVQGVGFRYFAQHAASGLGLTGYARNLDDGSVEIYASGSQDELSDFAARLRQGPRWADVRGVEEQEAAVQQYGSFEIES